MQHSPGGALHYTGFYVGLILFVGAFTARAQAKATWIESQNAARQGDAAAGAARGN